MSKTSEKIGQWIVNHGGPKCTRILTAAYSIVAPAAIGFCCWMLGRDQGRYEQTVQDSVAFDVFAEESKELLDKFNETK